MSEDRLTVLEELTAHQSKTIDELSEQVTEQWKVIDRMKRMLERLGERLETMESGSGEAPPVTKPPHY
jgi:SlyX protein